MIHVFYDSTEKWRTKIFGDNAAAAADIVVADEGSLTIISFIKVNENEGEF